VACSWRSRCWACWPCRRPPAPDEKDKAAKDKDKGGKLDLDKIPKKVMDTLKAKFPEAKIHKATREKQGADTVWDVEFLVGKRKCEADVKEDGTLIEYEQEIAAKDLPRAVSATVEKRYPRSTIEDVMEITEVKDKKESLRGYEINLVAADKRKIEITVAPDGKVLEDTGEEKKDKDKKKEDKK